ncbi:hypothetical protein GGI15_001271 [Coemansia interrupta]|uniref:Uncharacterized protein n=1 Tax=Coemansia interrupta TaxID=1126814 RepID=A0A9W8LN33_9FUNG|nr:hypothetical protein GGI15_001271 [Coemansia interrupta]
MVRLSLRSMAVMAFAVFAAASPVVDSVNRPAVENVIAQAPVAQAPVAQAPVATPAAAFETERTNAAAPVYVPQVPAFNPQDPRFDMNQMRRMIPCSESDCLKDMSPEEQQSFKRKCEELLVSQQKANAVSGKSRVANGGTELKYFQMTIPATANNQRVSQDATGKAGVNMTPEQEKEWMSECQKVACQKMEAAQSANKVGGQSRYVPVPPTAKEQAELQKEVKSLFGNKANNQAALNQGANGVAAGKGRPDGKNLYLLPYHETTWQCGVA